MSLGRSVELVAIRGGRKQRQLFQGTSAFLSVSERIMPK